MPLPIHVALLGVALALVLPCLRTDTSEAQACVIEADSGHIHQLTVSPAGEDSFKLNVGGLPLQVSPGPEGKAEVTLLAPLAFATTESIHRLDIRVAKRTALLDGRIVLAKGGALGFFSSSLAPQGDSVEAALPMSELKAEVPLLLPCDSLTVGKALRIDNPPNLMIPDTGIRFIQDPSHLPLYAKADEHSPFWMSFAGPLQVVSFKKGWLQVKAEWDDGSMLRGWVPERLAKVEQGKANLGLRGIGGLGIIGCGHGHGPSLHVFQLRAGAPIHSGPRGAIWAHTASAINVTALALGRSDGWMQIAAIDGLPAEPCSAHNKIWVHARDLVWTDTPL